MTNNNDRFSQAINKLNTDNQDGLESSDVVNAEKDAKINGLNKIYQLGTDVADAEEYAKIEIDNAEKTAKITTINKQSETSSAIYELITDIIKSRCMKCLMFLVIIVLFLSFIFLIVISVGATVHNYDKGETYFLSFQVIDQQNARDIVLMVSYIFIGFLGGLFKGKHYV